ncbi:MAG TPA: hypothetical protein VK757_07920 [Candidatus Acidoferrum sp.]|jgi:hypothetical protein|nr:hypothetical protein [Candidatus Acidoferrum sp.]
MDERQEPIHVVREEEIEVRRSNSTAWLAAGIVVLVIALGLTVGYIYQQQSNSKILMSHDSELNSTVSQMQNQIDTLTSKLNQPAASPAPSVTPEQLKAANAAAKHRAAEDAKRFNTMQSSIDDQQKALADTQNQVSQTRSDLEAGINSTRDDLNGSIARTHDELVSLEQKGERSYFEFDITKAKHFQKEGPLMVSLRKTDPKHKKYDLAMVVDDNQLSKKNVNLYEPVWIAGGDHAQVQLVVNKVDKDHIHGYVSAPKYAESASMTNVSERTGTTMGGANKNTDDTSATPAGNANPADGAPSSAGGAPVTTTPEPQPEQQP